MNPIRYPYSRPNLTDADRAALSGVLDGDMLTQGPHVDALERAFVAATGAPRAVSCSSGTAALHLIYMGLGVGPNAGVVVPEITFLATANAARMCGAPVWFADVDPTTGLMTAETLAAALDSAPFPIVAATPVHLSGAACDMPALASVADARNVALVEDACHAPGALYRDADGAIRRIGECAHSRAASFSLHAIKHIAAGEGGMIMTADDALADRLQRLRSHGMTRDPADWLDAPNEPHPRWYYEMHELGWNYRLTDVQAALARSQLERLEANVLRRQAIAARYDALLADDARIRTPAAQPDGWRSARHLYPLSIGFGDDAPPRGEVMRRLAEAGVGSQVLYIPVSRQPYYRAQGALNGPGAARYYARTLAIPMYETLEDDDQHAIVAALREALR